VLRSAMLSGNRTRRHRHYLRGSLFCGQCGHVLVFSRVRGKMGTPYEYYGCLSRQGRRARVCRASHIRVTTVERAVEAFYVSVRLSQSEQEKVRSAVRAYAEHKSLTARGESDRHKRRLRTLQHEQQKLLQAFYRGNIDEDVLASEQRRIGTERQAAERWTAAAKQDGAELEETLERHSSCCVIRSCATTRLRLPPGV
jgi:site-specific DNA recombinase